MKVKYKIIQKFPEVNKIVVRFYTDRLLEEHLHVIQPDGEYDRSRCITDVQISLPYPCPVGQDLHDAIWAYAPMMYERLLHAEDIHVDKKPNPLHAINLHEEKVLHQNIVIERDLVKGVTVFKHPKHPK